MSKKLFPWGKKIFEDTMKYIFQKHFVFNSDLHSWFFNPNDPEKVQKRVVPTIHMVGSWTMEDIMQTWTDRIVVENFILTLDFVITMFG